MSEHEHPDYPIDPETGEPARSKQDLATDPEMSIEPESPQAAFAKQFEIDVLTKVDDPEIFRDGRAPSLIVEALGLQGDPDQYDDLGPEGAYRLARQVKARANEKRAA